MRDYIFRGKRKDNSEWVTGSLVSTGPDEAFMLLGITGHIKRDDYECYMVEVIPETVGQFTGLKDKNGKDIFEGDTLKRTQQIDGNFIDRLFEKYEVAYNPSIAGFEYKPIDGKEYKQYTVRPFGGEEIEIIGNIHEVNQPVGGALNMKDAALLDPGTKQTEATETEVEQVPAPTAGEAMESAEEEG